MTRHRITSALLSALVLVAATVAACGGAVPSPSTLSSAGVAAQPLTVSVAEADQLRQSGAFLLDVREPSEWAAGHIAGATLIPLGQLSGRASELPRDRTIVVVCHSGNRSAQGRDILLGAGFTSVTSMAGGMSAWTAAGLPVTTGS